MKGGEAELEVHQGLQEDMLSLSFMKEMEKAEFHRLEE